MVSKAVTGEVSRVLEMKRELVFSMVNDTDDYDADIVILWNALAQAQQQLEMMDKYSKGLLAKAKLEELRNGTE